MKSINQSELGILVETLNNWTGSIVQKIFSSQEAFGLGLWTKGGLKWIWISLEKSHPIVLPLEEIPSFAKKKTTPTGLFLSAHIKGKILNNVLIDDNKGRVIEMHFSDCKIEIRLFPQGVNLIVYAGQKKISYEKIKDIPAPTTGQILGPARSLEELVGEWITLKTAPQKISQGSEKSKQTIIQKNQKAILKIENDIEVKLKIPWREFGNWLKAHQSLSVPTEHVSLVDPKKSWQENMKMAFEEAKKNAEKIKRAQVRIEELKNASRQSGALTVKPVVAGPKNMLSGLAAKGRTFPLDAATAFMGKSASDNLKILRGANAWDYWLHLKNLPSAHVIISRPKGLKIAEDKIKRVAEWLIKESVKKNYQGIAYEIIMCECRYVKPIKGDKMGRVQFQNERVFRVKVDT